MLGQRYAAAADDAN